MKQLLPLLCLLAACNNKPGDAATAIHDTVYVQDDQPAPAKTKRQQSGAAAIDSIAGAPEYTITDSMATALDCADFKDALPVEVAEPGEAVTFGGFTGIVLEITNNTNAAVDEAVIQISYYNKSTNVLKESQKYPVYNLRAGSSKQVTIRKNDLGGYYRQKVVYWRAGGVECNYE